MEKNSLIILAAGRGKRMNSDIPKALTNLNGISLIENLLNTIKETSHRDVSIIVGFNGEMIIEKLSGAPYNFFWQREQLGTGHAVKQAEEFLKGRYDNHLILCGDSPFISKDTIESIISTHEKDASVITMVTLKLKNFDGENSGFYHFGRIIRDDNGDVLKIVEFKDASEDEKNITEVNVVVYCIRDSWLWKNLEEIKNNNNQKEYYLTDLIQIARLQGLRVNSIISHKVFEMMGVNTAEELLKAQEIYKKSHSYVLF